MGQDITNSSEILVEPVPAEIEDAEKILLLSAMSDAILAERERKLTSLCPESWWIACYQGKDRREVHVKIIGCSLSSNPHARIQGGIPVHGQGT